MVEVAFARFFGSCDADFGAEIHPERATGECGIAVASKYFSVGAVVPWAEAGTGCVATIISAAAMRVICRPFRQRCHPIQDQVPMTTAIASLVIQPWA